MKLNYYPETDSLYIEFSSRTSVRSEVVSEGVVLDYDEEDRLVGMDIDNASKKINLNDFSFSKIPNIESAISDSN